MVNLSFIDRLSDRCGRVSDLLVILITVLLTFEVVARYVFSAPTRWTSDIAVSLQIWFVYIGMAAVLRQGQMIRITALIARAPERLRYFLEGLSLVVICAFSVVAVVKGMDMLLDSIRLGRRQPTMIALPNWVSEVPVVLGFALLSVQSLLQLIRLPFGPAPVFAVSDELEAEALQSHSGASTEAHR